MAMHSVANRTDEALASRGSDHDLWIGEKRVLTIVLDRKGKGCPPHTEHCKSLNRMIQDLARAAKAVVYQAENDVNQDATFITQSIDGIAEAITLLSQLSTAVQSEVTRADGA